MYRLTATLLFAALLSGCFPAYTGPSAQDALSAARNQNLATQLKTYESLRMQRTDGMTTCLGLPDPSDYDGNEVNWKGLRGCYEGKSVETAMNEIDPVAFRVIGKTENRRFVSIVSGAALLIAGAAMDEVARSRADSDREKYESDPLMWVGIGGVVAGIGLMIWAEVYRADFDQARTQYNASLRERIEQMSVNPPPAAAPPSTEP